MLLKCIGEHDQALNYDDQHPTNHIFIHEHDHGGIDYSADQVHKRMHNCNASLMVPLQTVVQRLVLL